MIKNYRQIAKSGPRVVWVGVGKTQGGTLNISPIFDKIKMGKSEPLTFMEDIPMVSDHISISAQE